MNKVLETNDASQCDSPEHQCPELNLLSIFEPEDKHQHAAIPDSSETGPRVEKKLTEKEMIEMSFEMFLLIGQDLSRSPTERLADFEKYVQTSPPDSSEAIIKEIGQAIIDSDIKALQKVLSRAIDGHQLETAVAYLNKALFVTTRNEGQDPKTVTVTVTAVPGPGLRLQVNGLEKSDDITGIKSELKVSYIAYQDRIVIQDDSAPRAVKSPPVVETAGMETKYSQPLSPAQKLLPALTIGMDTAKNIATAPAVQIIETEARTLAAIARVKEQAEQKIIDTGKKTLAQAEKFKRDAERKAVELAVEAAKTAQQVEQQAKPIVKTGWTMYQKTNPVIGLFGKIQEALEK